MDGFSFLTRIKNLSLVLCVCSGFLQGCASSEVSRDAASGVDAVYDNSSALVSNAGKSNPVDSYRNSSQIMQGAGVGSVVGAAGGAALVGSVGLIPGALGGAVVGGVLGAFVERNGTIMDRLDNRGCQVLVLGDHVMIIMPSEQIFRGLSSSIQPSAYTLLDLVAKMVKESPTMLVKVSAHTYGGGSSSVNSAISLQQANAVVKYLGPRSDTRLITAMGYGDSRPVDVPESGANYRLEITFEKLPV